MKTELEKIKRFLEHNQWARERRAKQQAIAFLLATKYGEIEDGKVTLRLTRKSFADMLAEASTLDRCWRKCLEMNPELRGTDYFKKDELEEDAINRIREIDGKPPLQKTIFV